jgi:hypothetical protein
LLVGDPNSGWTSLDGTWTHDNNSDAWDGSQIGGTFSTGGFGVGNGPGGTSLGTQGQVNYLRLQDTGDPRDYGYPDPSNRKVYFGHNIGSDIDPGKALTIMRDGVTLTFRARLPTLAKAGQPLDPLHRDGQQASGVQPYPTNGDGYVTSDGGKGNFVVREGGNGADVPAAAIAFSFTQTTDTTGGDPKTGQAGFAGLTFNEFNGNVPTANVNFGQGTKTNVVAFDPTDWHELYIVIRGDPANIGTHEAFIFLDGNLRPSVYKITGGTGADMNDSFLALGGSATPQNWALDVDWFGYKDEAVFPPGALLPPSLFGFVPVDGTPFHPVASNFRFSASALMPANTLPASGFKLILNGQNVSSQLALTGTDASKSRTATFSSLQANTIYKSTLIVTDSGGLSTTNEIAFDTFAEAQTTVMEAEDYNHSSGQFIDNPAPGAYANLAGTFGVDFLDTTPASLGTYRTSDPVDTQVTADNARQKFVSAGQPDYQIAAIGRGEWWNCTRTLAAGNYYAYLRCAATAAQDVRLDRITSDITQPNQTGQFLGNLSVPRTGTLTVFGYAVLADVQGNPIPLPLSGKTTLRLTAPSAGNNLVLNYLVLVPAAGGAPTAPMIVALPAPDAAGVLPDVAVEAAIYDGSNPVDKNSVKLRVDGTEVGATVVKTGTLTQIKYTPATMWASGSTHALELSFNDGTARSLAWGFSVTTYLSLTPGMKVTGANTPGFVWRMFQNEANQDNTVQRAEDALAGRLTDAGGAPLQNLADANVPGPASGPGVPASPGSGTMTFGIATVINVSQTSGTSFGSFTPDEQMPGIPGITYSTDGIAAEIMAFVQLPRGFHTMGVNSDDGFRTTAGFLTDAPLRLGEYDGGRSAGDTLFSFAVHEAGVYAFRTVWFEGGGDASIEWFIVNADGTRVLLNDTASGGAPAFQVGTVPSAPRPTLTLQATGDGQVTIAWGLDGTLQVADAVTGPYQDVVGAARPYRTTASGTRFYRVAIR